MEIIVDGFYCYTKGPKPVYESFVVTTLKNSIVAILHLYFDH